MVHNVSKITARLSQLSHAQNGSQAVVGAFYSIRESITQNYLDLINIYVDQNDNAHWLKFSKNDCKDRNVS